MVDVPYKFVGGKSAKAQEVNANFNYLISQINNLTTIISSLEATVTDLQNNKANLNGSTGEQFSVARAEGAYMSEQAVPYSQLSEMLETIKPFFTGFTLSTFSTTKGQWGLVMGAGTCWDSTGNYIIKNSDNISQSFDGQVTMPGMTYKIWVMSNTNNPSNISIHIGTGDTPVIGTGDIFKLIARVQTSSSGFGTITYVNGRIE